MVAIKDNFTDKYESFNSLLLYFLEQTYYPKKQDKDTIRQFVEENTTYQIHKTIEQAREVLALVPFPDTTIADKANKYPFNKSHESNAEDYHEWVQWMVIELEKEAEKQNKLLKTAS